MSDEVLRQVKWLVDQALGELGSYFSRIESGRYRAVVIIDKLHLTQQDHFAGAARPVIVTSQCG